MNRPDFNGAEHLQMVRAERLYQFSCAAAIVALIAWLLI